MIQGRSIKIWVHQDFFCWGIGGGSGTTREIPYPSYASASSYLPTRLHFPSSLRLIKHWTTPSIPLLSLVAATVSPAYLSLKNGMWGIFASTPSHEPTPTNVVITVVALARVLTSDTFYSNLFDIVTLKWNKISSGIYNGFETIVCGTYTGKPHLLCYQIIPRHPIIK